MIYERIEIRSSGHLIYKWTVEERQDGMFIVTFWDCDYCLENDRSVFEYETHSFACCEMYRMVFEHMTANEYLRNGIKMEVVR